MTPTRMQILDHVEHAFVGGGPITTEELRETAAHSGADSDVLVLLGGLPLRTFASPREIWPFLPDLPVGA